MMAAGPLEREIGAAEAAERLPQVNETVSGRGGATYRLLSVLGEGGYGTVFAGVLPDGTGRVAVKTEKYSRSVLHVEAQVLKVAGQQRCRRLVELLDYGEVPHHYCFVVMPLLGKNLHDLRNQQRGRKFTQRTAVRVAIMTLQGIEELHQKCGFVSRDIKAGNFAVGLGPRERDVFLIDFGLARKYIDRQGRVLPSRGEVGWRGTTRYGSLNAHLKSDLGRKDDVESWFYTMVELTKGALPWRAMTDRTAVHSAKLNARKIARTDFLSGCFAEFHQILDHIDALSFSDAPNYAMMIGLLETAMNAILCTWDQPFDWEKDSGTPTTEIVEPVAPLRQG